MFGFLLSSAEDREAMYAVVQFSGLSTTLMEHASLVQRRFKTANLFCCMRTHKKETCDVDVSHNSAILVVTASRFIGKSGKPRW